MAILLREVPLSQVPIVEPEATLDTVIELMEAEPLKTVVLVGDGAYAGIFNEEARDSNLIPAGADLSTLAVGPYVHPMRVIAHPTTDADQLLALMERRKIRVVPVVENNIYRGVVTRTVVEKAIS